jgi:hypothetical protein
MLRNFGYVIFGTRDCTIKQFYHLWLLRPVSASVSYNAGRTCIQLDSWTSAWILKGCKVSYPKCTLCSCSCGETALRKLVFNFSRGNKFESSKNFSQDIRKYLKISDHLLTNPEAGGGTLRMYSF